MENSYEYEFHAMCCEQYPHISAYVPRADLLFLPTNRYMALVTPWFTDAIYRPIADMTRPDAGIKYLVFSVLNCLSGRLAVLRNLAVDDVDIKRYETLYTKWQEKLKLTDGQVKLLVVLLDKFQSVDRIQRLLNEELFHYMLPEQLMFIQAVFGSISSNGENTPVWQIESGARLFLEPISDRLADIAGNNNRHPKCPYNQLPYYVCRSFCTLFDHVEPALRLSDTQQCDIVNILDILDWDQRLDVYMRILTDEQAAITYL